MSTVQHFVSISGGKDSTAVACLAVERMNRRGGGNLTTRVLFADTGNEHPATTEHVAYLGDKLGIQIETVRANFDHDFTVRRENIRADWSREKRRTEHAEAAFLPDCSDPVDAAHLSLEILLFRAHALA